MVKYVAINSLRPGVDPDEAYKYWRNEHAKWAKKRFSPEAKKFIINRVVHRLKPGDIFGFVEIYFDDLESGLRAMGRVINTPSEFREKFITVQERIFVEEEEIKL